MQIKKICLSGNGNYWNWRYNHTYIRKVYGNEFEEFYVPSHHPSKFSGSEVRLARRREREWVRHVSLYTESNNTKIPDSNTALAVCHKCNAKMKLAKCANQYVAIVTLKDKWYLHNTP